MDKSCQKSLFLFEKSLPVAHYSVLNANFVKYTRNICVWCMTNSHVWQDSCVWDMTRFWKKSSVCVCVGGGGELFMFVTLYRVLGKSLGNYCRWHVYPDLHAKDTYECVYTYIYIYIYMYEYIYIHSHVCIYVYASIYMCVCVYRCKYPYTNTHMHKYEELHTTHDAFMCATTYPTISVWKHMKNIRECFGFFVCATYFVHICDINDLLDVAPSYDDIAEAYVAVAWDKTHSHVYIYRHI